MGTMDNAIAPIGNIKFDIEVALGRKLYNKSTRVILLLPSNFVFVYRATTWCSKPSFPWNGQ